MKRLGFILALFCLATFSMYAQNPDIIVTGATSVQNPDPCLQSHATLTVKNVSNDTLEVLCEKIHINTTTGTSNFFCWGANCYGSNTYVSSSHNTLDPGESDNIDFGGYYDAFCASAIAVVEYCFYPKNDSLNRTCITITYNGSSTSISSDLSKNISDFYPNPAREYTSLDYHFTEVSNLQIVDVLGNTVKDINLEESSNRRVYVGDLSEGLYFGNLLLNDEIISTKKLIVKK